MPVAYKVWIHTEMIRGPEGNETYDDVGMPEPAGTCHTYAEAQHLVTQLLRGPHLCPEQARLCSEKAHERLGFDSVWDDHPDWPPEGWYDEAGINDTRLGYWDWVEAQIEMAAAEDVEPDATQPQGDL